MRHGPRQGGALGPGPRDELARQQPEEPLGSASVGRRFCRQGAGAVVRVVIEDDHLECRALGRAVALDDEIRHDVADHRRLVARGHDHADEWSGPGVGRQSPGVFHPGGGRRAVELRGSNELPASEGEEAHIENRQPDDRLQDPGGKRRRDDEPGQERGGEEQARGEEPTRHRGRVARARRSWNDSGAAPRFERDAGARERDVQDVRRGRRQQDGQERRDRQERVENAEDAPANVAGQLLLQCGLGRDRHERVFDARSDRDDHDHRDKGHEGAQELREVRLQGPNSGRHQHRHRLDGGDRHQGDAHRDQPEIDQQAPRD